MSGYIDDAIHNVCNGSSQPALLSVKMTLRLDPNLRYERGPESRFAGSRTFACKDPEFQSSVGAAGFREGSNLPSHPYTHEYYINICIQKTASYVQIFRKSTRKPIFINPLVRSPLRPGVGQRLGRSAS